LERQAYILADNKLAENAGWDDSLLKIKLNNLNIESDFDLSVTGFSVPEIDLIIHNNVIEEEPLKETEESINQNLSENPVTQLGDVWLAPDVRLVVASIFKK